MAGGRIFRTLNTYMRHFFSLCFAAILSVVMITKTNAAEYNISCYDCTTDWYEGLWIDYDSPELTVYNGWNIILKGTQGENIVVCVLDMDNAGELIDGRTYTGADIVTDWSGVTLYGRSEDLSTASGITYVQTHDEAGKLHVAINMTGKSGNTYNVTYDEKCEMIGDIQELQFTDDQVTLVDNTNAPAIRTFQIIAEIPGEMSMMVCVNSSHLVGEYTINDVLQDYSDITWGNVISGEYSVLKFCDLDMKVTADPEKPGAYYYDITVVTKVGWAYHTVLHSKPWEKPDIDIIDTKTITASNLRMMDYRDTWGELLFIASSPEYGLNLYVYSDEPQGTFTSENIDFNYNYVWYYDEDGVERQTTAIDGEYTYTETPDGNRSLIGWIDCTNGVKYILDLHYDHATPTRVETVTIPQAVLEDQRGPDGGGIIIQGETTEQYVLIGIYTPEIEGSYTEQDMDWQTTYIVEFGDDGKESVLELLDANVTVADSGDGKNYNIEARMTMQAEMDKTDIVEYIIDMTAYCPTGINNIENNAAPKAKVRKIMRNGRIIIVSDDNLYNTQGVRLK